MSVLNKLREMFSDNCKAAEVLHGETSGADGILLFTEDLIED
jgi:hypothetical protein